MMRVATLASALLLSLAAWAQAPAPVPSGALLAAPGTQGAWLHGQPLLPGTAILPGETVTTGSGGVLVVAATNSTGGALELTGNAELTIGSSGQVHLVRGNALIYGGIAVTAPQGQTFLPAPNGTRYVVNAGLRFTRMGVLAGSVAVAQSHVFAGQAVQLSAHGLQRVQMATLTQPPPSDAITKLVPASVSQ